MDANRTLPRERCWTKREQQQLRRLHKRGLSRFEIAAKLDRTPGAVRTRLNRLGLLKNRQWTNEQIAFAIANRGKLTAKQIGDAIGRTDKAVHLFFRSRGLAVSYLAPPAELLALIREKHALGWCDAYTTAEWNATHDQQFDRRYVCQLRRRMGLPSNRGSEVYRQRVAQSTREQCKRAGVESLAEIRAKAFRKFAERQGWPADLRPRHVQILKLLYERGPHTRPQIVKAMGMVWRGSRASLKSNDPEGSYLAHLMKRGMVIQLPRLVKQKGKGTSLHLYAVAPHVQRKDAI